MKLLTVRVDELRRGDLLHLPNTVVRVIAAVSIAGRRDVTVTLEDGGVFKYRADSLHRIEAND